MLGPLGDQGEQDEVQLPGPEEPPASRAAEPLTEVVAVESLVVVVVPMSRHTFAYVIYRNLTKRKGRAGAEWVVEFKAMGQTWLSRSRAETVNREAGRFAYRSMTDDGNPSHADWTWLIEDTSEGTRVTLSWDLHPKTLWRRVLLARIRARQLGKEIPASPAALERVATPAT